MKLENSCHQSKDREQLQAEWHYVDKKVAPHQIMHFPKARFKHQCFIYQSVFYVYGGTTIQSNDIFDDPLDLYYFSLNNSSHPKWQKARLKCNSKDVQNVSGHCGVAVGNRWFMFGGTNGDFKSNNNIWRLNIDTLEFNKLDTKGDVPSPRQSATMVYIQNSWLLLYGGINTNSVEIYNTFHFFHIDTKIWWKCDNTQYVYQAFSRYDSALCYLNEKVYLFGGTYRSIGNEQMYLNDFYEITPVPFNKYAISTISMRRITSPLMPQPRSGHSLVGIEDNYLLLIGGENSTIQMKEGVRNDDINLVSNAWIYKITTNSWTKLSLYNSNNLFKYSTQFSCIVENNSIYMFGGLHSYTQILNDFIQIKVPLEQVKKLSLPQPICPICQEKKLSNNLPQITSASIIEDIADNIDFPFAAIGLLIDNSINHLPTFVSIIYNQQLKSYKRKTLQIQDNSTLQWTDEEFFASMSSFGAGSINLPTGIDKKIKASIIRDHLKRQYCTNIKVASLRLGSGFLHISVSEKKEAYRVCLFKKLTKLQNERFILKYYSFCMFRGSAMKQEMKEIQKQIESEYGCLIKEAITRQHVQNTLYILDPKVQEFKNGFEEEEGLKVHERHNDIINGSMANFIALQQSGYNITDCVDVSLRAYLVSLYLKNQQVRISLGVKNLQPTPISTQVYLQRVDKLCKHKHVFQINSVVDFQFKIVELYYLYDLKKRLNYFNNGLLIYHKNRLISRYKYNLGELIPRKIYKMEGNYNFIRLFGFIELPDHVPVNIFKTSVTHPIMMEKLYSRLKFVSKMFKKELQRLAVEESIKRIAPTKLSNSQIEQDHQQNPEFVPNNTSSSKQKQANIGKQKQANIGKRKQKKKKKQKIVLRKVKVQKPPAKIYRMSAPVIPRYDSSISQQSSQNEGGQNKQISSNVNGKILEQELVQENCQIKQFPPYNQHQNHHNKMEQEFSSSSSDDENEENQIIQQQNCILQQQKPKTRNSLKISFPIKILRVNPNEPQVNKQADKKGKNIIAAENFNSKLVKSKGQEKDMKKQWDRKDEHKSPNFMIAKKQHQIQHQSKSKKQN